MKRVTWLLVVVFGLSLAACGEEEVLEEEGTGIEMQVSALSVSCSSDGSKPSISKYRVKVVDNNSIPPEVVADISTGADQKVLRLDKIPESNNLELTLIGLTGDSSAAPVYFSRARGIQVEKGKTTPVFMALGEYADYSCLAPPPGAPNVLFPTVTALPSGDVLIAGGFSLAADPANLGAFEISGPSDRAYIYDVQNGTVSTVDNLMNRGRGAHSAILLPKKGQVLLVGGTDRMYKDKGKAKFPWYFRKEMMGDVGNTYEIYDIESKMFLRWDENWPDKSYRMTKSVRRVFPGLSLNNDGTVLVTGGGQWRSVQTMMETDQDYKVAEMYRPQTESYEGGFMDSFGALTMKAIRAGHTSVLMEVKDKLAHHLFWGGTDDSPVAEVYQESSGQLDGIFGMFRALEFQDNKQYDGIKPFFHSFTPLKDSSFLLAGGVLHKTDGLAPPEAGHAYLVRITDGKANLQAIKGMTEGRYFHQAYSFDNQNVVLMGGFGMLLDDGAKLFAPDAMDDMRFFNSTSMAITLPAADKKGLPRGGFGLTVLPNDCVVLVGGVDNPAGALEFDSGTLPLIIEQYCPSTVCPESMWGSARYPEN